MENVKAVVLAAGKGTRLHSEEYDLPKVLREADGKPLLHYVLEALDFLPEEDIILVVGYQGEKVRARFPGYSFATQTEQNGTGDAVKSALPALEGFDGTVLVCCGDMPLIRRETFQSLLEEHRAKGNTCTFLTGTSDLDLPYGRVLRHADGSFDRVVEYKDCTPEEKDVRELNAGVYAFEAAPLRQGLAELTNDNKHGEYYLTDVPAKIDKNGGTIGLCCRTLNEEIIGVNTPEQLREVEEHLRRR